MTSWDRALGHIKVKHCTRKPGVSTFFSHVSVEQVVRTGLNCFQLKQLHTVFSGRTWYFYQFDSEIGYDGASKKACRWVAILMEGNRLVTAFPVVSPCVLQKGGKK